MDGHPSIERIIDKQYREWEMRLRREASERQVRTTVAISRQPGAGGDEYARELADALGFDLFDKEIVQRIAERSHLSEAMVATLDERVRSRLTEWLMMMDRQRFLWPHQYLRHLTNVIGVIAQRGSAVILGRGSAFILSHGESLRVSIVAPLDERARRFARRESLSLSEARRRVEMAEAERREFLKRYFNGDPADPTAHDLTFNTAFIEISQAVAATKELLIARGAGGFVARGERQHQPEA